ncbi:MAG: PAS domain S-box protein [Acidobacteria bacterium]|nr:PAS domain S-box protein [Acidobacteriota bacterium]
MSAQAQRDWPPGVRIRRGLVRVAPTVLAKIFLTVFLGQFAVVLFLDWLDLSWGLGSGLLAILLLTLLIVAPLYFGMFRPLAAQAARASTSAGEAKYQGLLEAAPDGVVVIDRKGRMVLVNAQAEKMFGYSREEMLGQPIELLVPQRFHGPHIKHHATYFSDPGTRTMGAGQDLLGRRKDGSEFPVDISLSPFQAEEGLLVTSIVRDITERKRAEEERQRSAERFRQLLEALPVAIRVVQKGVVAFCNSADAILHGYEGPEEIIGTDAFPYFVEEDVARLREYADRRAAGDPTVPTRYEARAKRQDGSVIPVELVVTRILYGGQPASLTALYDLSERKRLQLYESILPVCCVCGKVRDDTGTEQGKGAWQSLQTFVMEHSDTSLSHTFCPPCYQEYRQQQGLPPEAL